MLEIRHLSVSYGDEPVVRNASLVIPTGTITVLVGPNGIGKTTLLHAVCGLLPSRGGSVIVDGVDVTSSPTHKRGVGMLFQSTQLFPSLDVEDNVAFGLVNSRPRMSRSEISTRVDEVLSLVDMTELRRENVTALSGGQCRRIDIARTLAPQPRALLLDEPTSMLDVESIAHFVPRVRKYVADHAISALCITHDRDEAAAIGDAVLAFTDIIGR